MKEKQNKIRTRKYYVTGPPLIHVHTYIVLVARRSLDQVPFVFLQIFVSN
jgi:hypothetical protein